MSQEYGTVSGWIFSYVYENVPLGLNGSFCKHEGKEDGDHSGAQMLYRMTTNNMMRPAVYGLICSFFHLG